jgi:hypothetical protein
MADDRYCRRHSARLARVVQARKEEVENVREDDDTR